MKAFKKHLSENFIVYVVNIAMISLISFMLWAFFFSDTLKEFLLWLEVFFQTNKEYAYLIAFAMAIAEGTIILGLVPGTTYIVTAGVFWARGDMDPFILFPVVILGAFLGDMLGYTIGHFSSGFVRRKIGHDPNYKLAEDFVEKHGGKSVLFARFVSGIKEMVPFVAGILSMRMKKFMLWNFLGAIGWSVLFLSTGYFLGEIFTEVEEIVRATGLGVLTFFLITFYFLHKRNKKRFML